MGRHECSLISPLFQHKQLVKLACPLHIGQLGFGTVRAVQAKVRLVDTGQWLGGQLVDFDKGASGPVFVVDLDVLVD